MALTEETCAHCGLPVPAALFKATPPSFCCAGCESVYQILHSAGLAEYYAERERMGEEGRRVEPLAGSFAELDAPSYQALYCQPEGELQSTELALEGLHCAACVWLVERVYRLEPAVREARVDFARNRVALIWDPAQAPLSQVAQALSRMGYRPSPPRGHSRELAQRRELRDLILRMGVAGAIAGNVMLMGLALYSGSVGYGATSTMDESTQRFFEIGSLLLSLPSLWAGSLFFRGAWAALRTRTPHMDLPIALGILAAFLGGTWAVFTRQGEIYFDTITTLIFLLLVGRYLGRKHQMSASLAAELLHSVTPAWAQVVRPGGQVERVAADELVVGDQVEVASGEVVPVDGLVSRGNSSLDMSLLSGESVPCAVAPGSEVPAGAVNQGGQLWVVASSTGQETRVARLLQQVEQALSQRTPLLTQAQRVAGKFTLLVLGLAGLTFAIHAPSSPWVAFQHALALLIVACPCALAMATPLALSAAASQAAKKKILFFRIEALERLATACDIVLDKTGTLTVGQLSLVSPRGDAQWWRLAAQAEGISAHPVARAVRQASFVDSQEEADLEDIQEILGQGVRALHQGAPLLVGSERFVRQEAECSPEVEAWLQDRPQAASPLLVAWAGQVRAVAWLMDRIQPQMAASLLILHKQGHRLSLLSGDHPQVVQAVAQALCEEAGEPGLFAELAAGVSPEEKLAFIAARSGQGRPVVMVGDGVNDAAALARADVGISVHGAAEASRLSADVYLAAAGAGDLVDLVEGARRTLRVIRRGMVFSLAYNAIGISLAVAGFLNPLLAAILMPISSLTVVTNAFRSRMFLDPQSGVARAADKSGEAAAQTLQWAAK